LISSHFFFSATLLYDEINSNQTLVTVKKLHFLSYTKENIFSSGEKKGNILENIFNQKQHWKIILIELISINIETFFLRLL
jgi:hypothetical protein